MSIKQEISSSLKDSTPPHNLNSDFKSKYFAINCSEILNSVYSDVQYNETLDIKYTSSLINYLNMFLNTREFSLVIILDKHITSDDIVSSLETIGLELGSQLTLCHLKTCESFLKENNALILSKSVINDSLNRNTYFVPLNEDFDVFHCNDLNKFYLSGNF